MKKDVSVNIRMSYDNKAWLERNAEIAGDTLSNYIRKIALGYKIKPPKEIGFVEGQQMNIFELQDVLTQSDAKVLETFTNLNYADQSIKDVQEIVSKIVEVKKQL